MKLLSKNKIPYYIKPFLWSYDSKAMDLQQDKKRILTNILNLGDEKATDWAQKTYSRQNIISVIKNPLPGEWSDKSIHFWSLIYGVKPGSLKRKIK